MKVYVITSGAYSEYHIMGVTLDRATAMEFVERFNKRYEFDPANVEEYDTDMFGSGDKLPFRVTVGDGSLQVHIDNMNLGGDVEEYGGGVYSATVLADDEPTAAKIAFDKIAQYKAEKAGL